MLEFGAREAEPFEKLLDQCRDLETRANKFL
jgi:hypothetical protein